MKRCSRLFVALLFSFLALAAGLPAAYAGCMDNAGDAVLGFLSGGASVAACELQELVDAIKQFIQTVSDLANNVVQNAKAVADAAIGAVRSAANDVANAVGNAQHQLASAASEAQTLASPLPLIAAPPIAALNNGAARPAPPARASNHTVAATAVAPVGATQAAAKGGVNHGPATAMAPIQLPADPQQLQAALQRGAQELSAMQSSVEGDIARRINDAVQRAQNQAMSHVASVGDIVQTALLAPINGLLNMLNDLVSHPTRLLDPIATINAMVQDISNSVVGTMNHINDVITKDAVNTLQGVEGDVQQIQSAAATGDKLLNAMRRARQQKTAGALSDLEAQLNAAAPRQAGGGFGRARVMAAPAMASFRFDNVRSKMNVTLQHSIAPQQASATKLKSSWAAIQSRHQFVKVRPLNAGARQSAEAELDRMFRGKSPAEIERTKQELLGQARQKFGSDPQLMAKIEQNLNEHVRTHYAIAAPHGALQAPTAPRPTQHLAPGAAGAQMR